jgi:hypothetical protein
MGVLSGAGWEMGMPAGGLTATESCWPMTWKISTRNHPARVMTAHPAGSRVRASREMVRVEAWPTTASGVRCYRSPISDRKIRTVEHRLPGPPWAPGPGRNQDIATLFLSSAVATTLAGAPRRLVTTTT